MIVKMRQAALNNSARPLSGILHQQHSANKYQLRRYQPTQALNWLVEQYWLVSWDLSKGDSHTQHNLPDPNFHLLFDRSSLSLVAPVSSSYRYVMRGSGELLAVKFKAGVLHRQLPQPLASYIDKRLPAEDLANLNASKLVQALHSKQSDYDVVQAFDSHLLAIEQDHSKPLCLVQELLRLIQTTDELYSVAQLSELSGTDVRTIQRLFHRYIGLPPKLLIRRYRLHQVLPLLEDTSLSCAEVAAQLGYTDQAHLIRDFQDILGLTPRQYQKSTPSVPKGDAARGVDSSKT